MIEPARDYQHYRVLQREDGSPWELGRGAMGVTYKAFDVNLCCEVALKVVNSGLIDHPDARDRFVREARAAAALRHRNVASVYHLGNDGEHFFYAMEFVDGETLDALVRRHGPLSTESTLRVILQVARALVAADRQHLVHRDIKPTNLMIVHEDADEDMTVKVIDFGLARPAAGVDGGAQVTMGGFVGTPQYASPEQLEERPVDARSDIYSLGITAWHLLTSRPPFSGSLAAVCQQQVGRPPPWDQLPPDLPVEMRDLLAHMLEKDPADRPQNARELRGKIEACLEKLSKQPGEPSVHPADMQKFSRRRAGPVTLPSNEKNALLPTLAEGRYRISRLLEENPGTRVYRARDDRQGGATVTIRTLPSSLTFGQREQTVLREEIRLIQAAANPHLVAIYAFEQAAETPPAFLVEEALAGFGLRDLLAARNGALPFGEALRLLEQAAMAVDHARRCRLEHLDLALPRVYVHFPFANLEGGAHDPARTLLPLPAEKWPTWIVKIHPFSTDRPDAEVNTWAGDLTLVPNRGVPTRPGTPATLSGSAGYLRSLAKLTYELLGGIPFPADGHRPRSGMVSLPALNEPGNAVLREALSGGLSYANGQEFHAALKAATSDLRPRGRQELSPILPSAQPADTKRWKETTTPRETNGSTISLTRQPPTRSDPAAAPASTSVHESGSSRTTTSSVAEFFRPEANRLPPAAGIGGGHGSVWERMGTARSGQARPGRWLLGLAAAAVVFVMAFAAVLALLLRGGSPPRMAHASMNDRLPSPIVTPVTIAKAETPIHPEIMAPRPDGQASVVSDPASGPTPAPTSAAMPLPAAEARENAFPRQPTVDAVPVASATPDTLVTVYLYSQRRGVEVRWHGALLGVTPAEVRLPPGEQELIVRFRDGPETHQTITLRAEQARANVEIRPMRPDLVPLNLPLPRPGPVPRGRPGSTASLRVEPAVPVAPPPGRGFTPVRRPSPLEPFVGESDGANMGQLESPRPTASEEDD